MDTAVREEYYTEADYYALPDDVRTELINGVFYDMAAPSQLHQEVLGELYTEIKEHIRINNGKCRVIPAPFDVKLEKNKDNIVQPDISVICDPEKLDGKRCNGAPDWIIEIVSPGNPAHDYIRKLNLYKDAGVREYWTVNPEATEAAVNVCRFMNKPSEYEDYELKDTVSSGIFETLKINFKEIMERIQ